MIPYAKQTIEQEDIDAVVAALTSDWLTCGPRVEAFEAAVCDYVGAPHGVAVNSGTAALHCALHALGVGPGDEVIVPTLTFLATANVVVHLGATPVFADVDAGTLLIDPASVEALVSERTVAVVAVDYAGQPCDYAALRTVTERHGLALVADAAHAIGARRGGVAVGALADLTTFSFHPAKGMTSAEGGMVVCHDAGHAGRMRGFRNHGMDLDLHQRQRQGVFGYEMGEPGYNYRLSDIQCALGLSQLARLDRWIARRNEIALRYRQGLADCQGVSPLVQEDDLLHAYHLFVIQIDESAGGGRDRLFRFMRQAGVGVNVHYPPVHLQPFYRRHHATQVGQCPHAERAAGAILSLPMFPGLRDAEVDFVIRILKAGLIAEK